MKPRVNHLLMCTLLFTSSIMYAGKHSHPKKHHKAHEHGVGKLNLVSEGDQVIVELEVPAHDIVGFEYQPKTPEQQSKVAAAMAYLKVAKSNLELPAAAQCHPHKEPKVEANLSAKAHAEFQMTYHFTCKNISQLTFLKVLGFKQFTGMKKLKAQALVHEAPFVGTLTPDTPQLGLRK
ncbi:MAG: DUF2796 domain-containing protein [Zetaproteobacteria bacterium]|nr:DUF2796 domain-containing protein [Zetaproteobacteria bacterium]